MNKTLFKFLAVLTITGLCSSISWADVVDPTDLHIGTGFNTSCALGCAGDPNLVPGGGFDIADEGGQTIGPSTSSAPLLLILAVPNFPGMPSGTITSGEISSVTFETAANNPSTASAGSFSAAGAGSTIYENSGHTYSFVDSGFTSGSIYDFLNLMGPADASNSFANYTLAGNDAGATSFTVFVFDIFGGTLDPKGLVQINFSPSLPLGTFASVYTQSGDKNFVNAFTEAGLVSTTTTTPEPTSLALFGTGVFGLAGLLRRRHAASSK